MTLPVLYSFRRCPYAMRARLAIAASGISCELREVKLSAKPQEMIEASPKATVPVLVLEDGKVIDQSLDIMQWALTRNDPENWLDVDIKACSVLIGNNDGAFKYHLDRFKYPTRYEDIDPEIHARQGLQFLHILEGLIGQHGNLLRTTRSLADIAIMPFVRQFVKTDPAWFAEQPLPALKAWLADHMASSLFQTAMVRHEPWPASPDPVYFP